MLDGMESGQTLWHNRRVQRSGLFAFFVLTFIVIGLYSRREWPAMTGIRRGPTYIEGSDLPPSTSNGEPFYNPKIPEFDKEHMPKIPKGQTATKGAAKNSEHDPNLDPTRVAMIIETRSLAHLPALLSSYVTILPPQWVIRMIGTENAFQNVRESAPLARAVKTGRLVLTDLPDEYPVNGQEAISATLTNLTFYRDFLAPAEWLLIFQADSVLCAASDQTMDDWVEKAYPWVGAPWNPDVPGGNGGLSLRYVPRLISILEKESRKTGDTFWEDRWLCDRINDTALPPVAKYFSVESMWYERPLGYHLRGSGKLLDMTVWGNATRRRHIFKYCPETKLILGNMQLEDKDDEMLEAVENGLVSSVLTNGTESLLPNNVVAPTVETKVPADNAVAPAVETKVPADNAVAPAVETKVPADNAVAPTLETKVPVDNHVAPTVETKVPADNHVPPTGEIKVPADKPKDDKAQTEIPKDPEVLAADKLKEEAQKPKEDPKVLAAEKLKEEAQKPKEDLKALAAEKLKEEAQKPKENLEVLAAEKLKEEAQKPKEDKKPEKADVTKQPAA